MKKVYHVVGYALGMGNYGVPGKGDMPSRYINYGSCANKVVRNTLTLSIHGTKQEAMQYAQSSIRVCKEGVDLADERLEKSQPDWLRRMTKKARDDQARRIEAIRIMLAITLGIDENGNEVDPAPHLEALGMDKWQP